MNQKIQEVQQSNLKQKWKLLIDNLIRPPRKVYNQTDLGSTNFELFGKFFHRQDYKVSHNQKITDLSIFSIQDPKQYLILYLHCNSSNKLESLQILQFLPQNYSLACFDFSGCGLNKNQDTISLGIRQAQQTKSVYQFLKNRGYKVALWGRSMGAVTALIYGQAQIIIADSAFTSFKSVFKQASFMYCPLVLRPFLFCFFRCIFSKLKNDVNNAAQYNVQDLNVLQSVRKIYQKVVLILLCGRNDEIVKYQNSQQIFRNFQGNKKHLLIFEGTHNSKRPSKVIQKVINLIRQRFQSIKSQSQIIKMGRETQLTDMKKSSSRINEQLY